MALEKEKIQTEMQRELVPIIKEFQMQYDDPEFVVVSVPSELSKGSTGFKGGFVRPDFLPTGQLMLKSAGIYKSDKLEVKTRELTIANVDSNVCGAAQTIMLVLKSLILKSNGSIKFQKSSSSKIEGSAELTTEDNSNGRQTLCLGV